jgi:hypothetical protein
MPKKLRPAVDLMAFKYRTGKGQIPKKHRPTVDLMAFKCRTLKVNTVYTQWIFVMLVLWLSASVVRMEPR